jgi:hypothetical protein
MLAGADSQSVGVAAPALAGVVGVKMAAFGPSSPPASSERWLAPWSRVLSATVSAENFR